MPTLQHNRDSDSVTNGHAGLDGAPVGRALSNASEVHMLRQRVALLEQALAAAEAKRADMATAAVPLTSIDFAPQVHVPHGLVSEFSEPIAPAVVVITPPSLRAPAPVVASPAPVAPSQPATITEPLPAHENGFADAWSDGDVSFEERIAAKAFFQEGAIDDESRNWLLDQ